MSKPGLTICQAEFKDAASIARIHVLGWQNDMRGIVPDSSRSQIGVEKTTAIWQDVLESRGNAVFLASAGDETVGFCHVRPMSGTLAKEFPGEVRNIYILSASQRRGVGTGLLTAGFTWLASGGFSNAAAWVLEPNAKARSFFEKAGGQLVPDIQQVEQPGALFVPEIAYGWRNIGKPAL